MQDTATKLGEKATSVISSEKPLKELMKLGCSGLVTFRLDLAFCCFSLWAFSFFNSFKLGLEGSSLVFGRGLGSDSGIGSVAGGGDLERRERKIIERMIMKRVK